MQAFEKKIQLKDTQLVVMEQSQQMNPHKRRFGENEFPSGEIRLGNTGKWRNAPGCENVVPTWVSARIWGTIIIEEKTPLEPHGAMCREKRPEALRMKLEVQEQDSGEGQSEVRYGPDVDTVTAVQGHGHGADVPSPTTAY